MRMLTMCESVHTARGVFGSWCRAGSMAGCLASSMDVQGARSVVRAAALFYPRALGAQALGGARPEGGRAHTARIGFWSSEWDSQKGLQDGTCICSIAYTDEH